MSTTGSTNPQGLDGIKAWCRVDGDYAKSGSAAVFFIDAGALLQATASLKAAGYYLEDVCGVDVREGIMLVYHFDRFDRPHRITLRMIVPHDRKEAPSIVSIFSGADWHERETFDFYGVVFTGHPNLKPLLLPDDLGFHPLLKEQEDQRKSIHQLLPIEMVIDHGA